MRIAVEDLKHRLQLAVYAGVRPQEILNRSIKIIDELSRELADELGVAHADEIEVEYEDGEL